MYEVTSSGGNQNDEVDEMFRDFFGDGVVSMVLQVADKKLPAHCNFNRRWLYRYK